MSELGDILRHARQKRNISLLAASNETHIKQEFLEALENGDYAALPGPVYITGFLRNYARCLGLHPEDVVQEYYAARPAPQPTVKAATRVLASGYERQNRTRLLWVLAAIVLLLVGGYTIKQYNDSYAHAYSPPLNVTPANLGSVSAHAVVGKAGPPTIHLGLHAVAPVWVRVTADGVRRYQGILRPTSGSRLWSAHHSIYVVTYDGAHLKATYNGRRLGLLSHQPGLIGEVATSGGWHQAF